MLRLVFWVDPGVAQEFSWDDLVSVLFFVRKRCSMQQRVSSCNVLCSVFRQEMIYVSVSDFEMIYACVCPRDDLCKCVRLWDDLVHVCPTRDDLCKSKRWSRHACNQWFEMIYAKPKEMIFFACFLLVSFSVHTSIHFLWRQDLALFQFVCFWILNLIYCSMATAVVQWLRQLYEFSSVWLRQADPVLYSVAGKRFFV